MVLFVLTCMYVCMYVFINEHYVSVYVFVYGFVIFVLEDWHYNTIYLNLHVCSTVSCFRCIWLLDLRRSAESSPSGPLHRET